MILFASPRFTIGIADIPEDEGQAILDELFAVLDQSNARLEYQWSEGDVVMWDNRSVLHCAMGGYSYPDIRLINRTTVLCNETTPPPAGGLNTELGKIILIWFGIIGGGPLCVPTAPTRARW